MYRRRCPATAALIAAATLTLTGACALKAQTAPAAPSIGSPVASQPGGFQPAPIMGLNDPANKLHLTEDQQKKLNVVMQQFAAQRNALLGQKGLTQQQMQAKFVTIAKDAQAKALAILTPDQRKTVTEKNAQRQKYVAAANQAAAKAMAIKQQLQNSLTPAQKKKLQAMQQSGGQQINTIETSKSMSVQQKVQKEMGVRTSVQSKLQSILTPQQRSLYQQYGRYMDEANSLARLAQESGV